jgi:hypothetical protein
MTPTCPRCETALRHYVEGVKCPRCHWESDIRRKCPWCDRPIRPRMDSPDWWCELCRVSISAPQSTKERPPYRDGQDAIETFLRACERLSISPSATGPQLSRLEMGMIQLSSQGQIKREHEAVGDLAPPFASMDAEDQLLLEGSVNMAGWLDRAMKCDCKHVYLPTAKRCHACTHQYDIDLVQCPRPGCQSYRSTLVWFPCPECGSNSRQYIHDRSERLARLVTEHRREKFIKNHGRAPFERDDDCDGGGFNEGGKVGYCPSCQGWFRDDELMQGRRCRKCHRRVRWGIAVHKGAIGSMLGNTFKRWGKELRNRGLIP